MHAKTLIFDESVLLLGSVNLTHNGFENNHEHLTRSTGPMVDDVVKSFERDWICTTIVGDEDIEIMMKGHAERVAQKKSKENARLDAEFKDAEARKDKKTRSKSVGRSVSRSLSKELLGA